MSMSNLQADKPNWTPIEQRYNEDADKIGAWMWMYEVYDSTISKTVNFYKHKETREYLKLLPDGQELEIWKIANGVT